VLRASVDDLKERFAKASHKWSDFEWAEEFFWFIQWQRQLVGTIAVQRINKEMLTAEVGYGVAATQRGQGIATAMVRQLTREAFAHTPLRKLIAFVHEDNAASRRVLVKCGYRQEGLLLEHFLIDGKPVNEAIYGICRDK
jgi:[ribosomal protein S5]-alanine N-acetyltransferase